MGFSIQDRRQRPSFPELRSQRLAKLYGHLVGFLDFICLVETSGFSIGPTKRSLTCCRWLVAATKKWRASLSCFLDLLGKPERKHAELFKVFAWELIVDLTSF